MPTKDQGAAKSSPEISPIIFTDELWREQTIHPMRMCSKSPETGELRPTRAAPFFSASVPNLPLQTKAQVEEESDLRLWASCSSFDDYEVQRQVLNEEAEAKRREFMTEAGYFPCFNKLPYDLRFKIWKMATQTPTDVKMVVSKYKAAPISRNRCWGARGPASIAQYRAVATLPALLLVNHEAYAVVKNSFKVLFQNPACSYGVLAAFPTILRINEDGFLNILIKNHVDDLAVVETFVYTLTGHWNLIQNGGQVAEVVVKMKNLAFLEIIIANARAQNFVQPQGAWVATFIDILVDKFASRRKIYSSKRKTDSKWKIPEIRIVSDGDDKEFYSFNGGSVVAMRNAVAPNGQSS